MKTRVCAGGLFNFISLTFEKGKCMYLVQNKAQSEW